jgi:outer membrane lipoprotein-sorting protein
MPIRTLFPKCLLACSILFWSFAGQALTAQAQPSGRELAQQVYDRYVGDDSVSGQTMELIPAAGQKRVRQLNVSVLEKNGARSTLLRFTSPADIEGTGFLAIEDGQGETAQFLYLPALNRTRRIVAGQKGRSFVNTDFTYEDMERRPVDDSDHVLVGEESLNNVQCWIMESRPKTGTDSQYSMVRTWVAQDMLLPLRVDFFTGGDAPSKRYLVLQLENIQDIWTETKVAMEDLHSGHKTIMETNKIQYNTGVSDSTFTQQSLERW